MNSDVWEQQIHLVDQEGRYEIVGKSERVRRKTPSFLPGDAKSELLGGAAVTTLTQ